MKKHSKYDLLILFGVLIFFSALIIFGHLIIEEKKTYLLQLEQERESIKSMDCTELEQYILDDKYHWKFAQRHYEIRCLGDVKERGGNANP